MTRSLMVHRASVKRNNPDTDAYGQPGPPVWEDAGEVACKVWITAPRLTIGASGSMELRELSMVVPKGADLLVGDKVTITDRRGNLILGESLVLTISPRRDHWSVEIRRADAGLAG